MAAAKRAAENSSLKRRATSTEAFTLPRITEKIYAVQRGQEAGERPFQGSTPSRVLGRGKKGSSGRGCTHTAFAAKRGMGKPEPASVARAARIRGMKP